MLERCGDTDYFEKGIEMGVQSGLQMQTVDISDVLCTEIDFEEDLRRVNAQLGG